jgi:hypothetical protein
MSQVLTLGLYLIVLSVLLLRKVSEDLNFSEVSC